MKRFEAISLYISLIGFLIPITADAAVWTVGPGGDFLIVQDAVNAAQDGDIVLVQKGSYDPVIIDHKGISVVGDGVSGAGTGTMTVRNIADHQTVVLSRLTCGPPVFPPQDGLGLVMDNNKGSVRCEDCTFRGADMFHPGRVAAKLNLCGDAAFMRCFLDGGSSTYDGDGGHGMDAAQSYVALYDCELRGGWGGSMSLVNGVDGGDGGDGFLGNNSFLFTSGSEFKGGKGGDGSDGDDFYPPGDGGDGGDGIELAGALSEGWILDSMASGGTGGDGGDGSGIWPDGSPGKPGKGVNAPPGAVHYLNGTAHRLRIDSPAREGEAIQLVFEGTPGDHAVILVSAHPGALFVKGLKGVFLLPLSPFPLVLYMGQLTAGSLIVPLTVPELGYSIEGIQLHTQSYFWNTSGMEMLGTAQTLFLLDGAF